MRSGMYILPILLLLLVLPLSADAQEINAGFVEGLWYSERPVFSGESVRIYAALRNNTESDLTGTVTFRDGNSVIATKEVSALSGRLIETWADWSPEYGEHTVSATLSDVQLHSVGEAPESVEVSHDLSESFVFVDRDTDGDGVGDEEDEDDDNDGVGDKEEASNGTDPLVSSTPEESEENTEEEATEEDAGEAEQDTEENASDVAGMTIDREGFEKYFDEGTVNALFSNVTERVSESKESLDTYRAERDAEKEQEGAEAVDDEATSTEGDDATITRTQLEEKQGGFMATLVAGIIGIADGLYTLLLWIISGILTYPALVQFILLLAILITLYKLAKWYGTRQQQ